MKEMEEGHADVSKNSPKGSDQEAEWISYQQKEVPGIPQAQIWKRDSQIRKTKSRKISAFRNKERLKANQKKNKIR